MNTVKLKIQKPWEERRKIKQEKESKAIQDYEENLKLHYESKRKELDLLLSSSLPHQISNIKMILWINFLFLGLSTTVLKSLQFYCAYLIPYLISLFAIISMLIALTKRRSKMYGGIDQLDYVLTDIEDGRYAKSKMLSGLLHNTYEAVEYNRDTLQRISKYLRFSILATFVAVVLFFTFVVILNFDIKRDVVKSEKITLMVFIKEKIVMLNKICILNKKGKYMSDKDKRPAPSEVNPPQHPIREAEERSFKPAPPPKKPKQEK